MNGDNEEGSCSNLSSMSPSDDSTILNALKMNSLLIIQSVYGFGLTIGEY